jgi:Glycosyltransferase family 28 C-terminal domain
VTRLDFVFFDAGGGHRAAANALRQEMDRRGSGLEIRLVNLQEVLDGIDIFRKATGIRLQDLYNVLLKRGWTLGSRQLLAGMHGVLRVFHRPAVRALEAFWSRDRPRLVVSLVPNLNRAMGDALRKLSVPLVTILTDLADYPPHFWMERQQQYFICGTERAVNQALEMGHPRERVFRVSGMILNPRFYELPPLNPEARARERATLGFDLQLPVGLLLFGGEGAAVMEEIAVRLSSRQLLAICGHNEKLPARLRALKREAPMFVEGFTREVPRYMQLADYLIGKPGPGSISEAVAMRLPVIVERNSWTLPQERYNTEWVKEQGVGLVVKNFRQIAPAVDQLLEPSAYASFRAATERIENRAVMEIPRILERLVGQGGGIEDASRVRLRESS